MDHFLAVNYSQAEFRLKPSAMGGGWGHEGKAVQALWECVTESRYTLVTKLK